MYPQIFLIGTFFIVVAALDASSIYIPPQLAQVVESTAERSASTISPSPDSSVGSQQFMPPQEQQPPMPPREPQPLTSPQDQQFPPSPQEPQQQTLPPEQPQRMQPPPPRGEFIGEEDYEERECLVDPRQIADAKRQIKDLGRRIKGVSKLAKKYGTSADIEVLTTVATEIARFNTIFYSGDEEAIADSIEDFWNGEYWQQVDDIDRRVRVPKEIGDLNRQAKRVEKLLNARKKQLQTVNTVLGFDTGILTQLFSQIKGIIAEADRLAKAGELEEASETLREIYDGGIHPGSIEGVVNELTNLAISVKRIKDQNIVSQIKTLLAEPLALVAEGDLQGSNEAFSEVRNQVYQLLEQGLNTNTKKRVR